MNKFENESVEMRKLKAFRILMNIAISVIACPGKSVTYVGCAMATSHINK